MGRKISKYVDVFVRYIPDCPFFIVADNIESSLTRLHQSLRLLNNIEYYKTSKINCNVLMC